MGYAATADAFRRAAADVTVEELTTHYTEGLARFHDELVPRVKRVLTELSGGAWDLGKHKVYAAGSDVDLMTHLIDMYCAVPAAGCSTGPVHVFPGDWWGFHKGFARQAVKWSDDDAALGCLCLPSVRNGHVTTEMVDFVARCESALWNLNLWPTLPDACRHAAAAELSPSLSKSLLSVSFSRGFGMTASQLGVLLVPPGHPILEHAETLDWLTFFHNAIAARAFCAVDVDALRSVDDLRRASVHAWLRERGLPVIESGSYYVKSFRVEGDVDERLRPLLRDDDGTPVVRLCFKPIEV
ncbi:MAG: hypothetical protein Q8O67_29860 [Deltaproteobacteria bacterium]|nr:hypothetical protein [Deltaproteobacteria bacterium]